MKRQREEESERDGKASKHSNSSTPAPSKAADRLRNVGPLPEGNFQASHRLSLIHSIYIYIYI